MLMYFIIDIFILIVIFMRKKVGIGKILLHFQTIFSLNRHHLSTMPELLHCYFSRASICYLFLY
jgi:hypothetical protein